MPKLCMPPIRCMPPKPLIEWAGNVGGTASIATTTAHPIAILLSMTILPVVTESEIQNIQMTNDLISDESVTSHAKQTTNVSCQKRRMQIVRLLISQFMTHKSD